MKIRFILVQIIALTCFSSFVYSETVEDGLDLLNSGKYQEGCDVFKKLVAISNNIEAQANLGGCYGLGLYGKKHPKKAKYWFEKAAESGRPDMQGRLGSHYFGQKQYDKAAPLILNAAESGDDNSKALLAMMYWQGWGVPTNKIKAYNLFMDRAKAGDEYSQEGLDMLCKESPWACK